MVSPVVPFIVFCMLLGPSAVSATCACQCIEGVARTLCTTLEEAAQNPTLCAPSEQRGECPAPPSGFVPQRFDAPDPGAHDCREARLLDRDSGEYSTTTRVCDTVRATDARS